MDKLFEERGGGQFLSSLATSIPPPPPPFQFVQFLRKGGKEGERERERERERESGRANEKLNIDQWRRLDSVRERGGGRGGLERTQEELLPSFQV